MNTLLTQDEIQALLHEFGESERDALEPIDKDVHNVQYDFFEPLPKEPTVDYLI